MSERVQPIIEVPQAAYDAGEAALAGYPFAQVDHLDAASDVINAAFPIALAAVYQELVDQLTELADEKYREAPQVYGAAERAAGLVEGILVIQERIVAMRAAEAGFYGVECSNCEGWDERPDPSDLCRECEYINEHPELQGGS